MASADEKYWLPLVACAATILGLEFLYRRTLVGRAFLAIAEDNFAARALGLPERNLRIASYAMAGAIGALAGFAGGRIAAGLLRQWRDAELLRLRPGRTRRIGEQPRRGDRRHPAGPVPAGGQFHLRRHLLLGRRLRPVHHRVARAPQGMFGAPAARRV